MRAQELYSTIAKHDYLNWHNAKEVTDFLSFDKNDMAKVTGISRNSIRYDSRMPKELAERIHEIANIINIVADFFDGDLNKTKLWYETKNPLLGDLSPRDMVRFGHYDKLRRFIFNAISGNSP